MDGSWWAACCLVYLNRPFPPAPRYIHPSSLTTQACQATSPPGSHSQPFSYSHLFACSPKSMQMPMPDLDVTHSLSHSRRPTSLPAAPFRLIALRHPGTPRSPLCLCFSLLASVMTIPIQYILSPRRPGHTTFGLHGHTFPQRSSVLCDPQQSWANAIVDTKPTLT